MDRRNGPIRPDTQNTRLERNDANNMCVLPGGHREHVKAVPGNGVARIEAHALDKCQNRIAIGGRGKAYDRSQTGRPRFHDFAAKIVRGAAARESTRIAGGAKRTERQSGRSVRACANIRAGLFSAKIEVGRLEFR